MKLFRLSLFTAIGVAGALLLRGPLVDHISRSPRPAPLVAVPTPAPPALADVRRQARERTLRHLDAADRAGRQAIDRQLKPLEDFFAQARKRTPGFAEEVLGWGSKWRFVADRMPFTRSDRHEEFLKLAFTAHLFTADQLEKQLRQVVKGYLAESEAIENRLLVDVRSDLQDLPPLLLASRLDAAAFELAFAEALQRASARTGAGLRQDVAQEVVSQVVGQVLAQVAVRLGVSAGVLGTGAATGWATLGIGLVVGIIVDQVISWVWDWAADPKGNLARELDGKLDELRKSIVDGPPKAPGMRGQLEQLATDRGALRRRVLLDVVQQ